MTISLLEAIRSQPGERSVEELAEDLGLTPAQVRRQVDRLRQDGRLPMGLYRLAPRLVGAKRKRISADVVICTGGRQVPDTRPAREIVGVLESQGGRLRSCTMDDLEVRIVETIRREPMTPGILAQMVDSSVHDGAFRRACQYLVRCGILLDWRAPWAAP